MIEDGRKFLEATARFRSNIKVTFLFTEAASIGIPKQQGDDRLWHDPEDFAVAASPTALWEYFWRAREVRGTRAPDPKRKKL